MGEIAWSSAPADTTLWGVYGPDCFPTIFACRLNDHPTSGRVIWGFSIYEGKPGFRTLGRGRDWADERRLRLFPSREEAFAYVAALLPAESGAGDRQGSEANTSEGNPAPDEPNPIGSELTEGGD